MKATIIGLVAVALCSTSVWAGSFSLDFNNKSTQLAYIQNLDTQNYGNTVAKARYLYNDDSNSSLFGVALGVVGSPGNAAGLKLGFDVALNGGQTTDDQKLLTIGLGFGAEYNPPALHGFGVDGHIVYSPEIFTFMDAEDYLDWGLGVSYQVLPNARIMLNYQNIQAEIKNRGDRDLDDSLRIGVKLDF